MKKYILILSLFLCVLKADKPMLDEHDDYMILFSIKEGAPLYSDKKESSKIKRKTKFLEPFIVIQKKKVKGSKYWYKVGSLDDETTMNYTKYQGWIKSTVVLDGLAALKDEKSQIYRKGIIKTEWNEKNDDIKGAKVYNTNVADKAHIHGPELRIQQVYYIFKTATDHSGENWYLLGNSHSIYDPEQPKNYIIGWVKENRVHDWITRQGLEYSSNKNRRQEAQIYESYDNIRQLCSGNFDGLSVVAKENKDHEIQPSDPRLFINKAVKINKCKDMDAFDVAFFSDFENLGDGKSQSQSKSQINMQEGINQISLSNNVDVMIVYDGTGSMSQYKDNIINVISMFNKKIQDKWINDFPTSAQPQLRISLTLYKDYKNTSNGVDRDLRWMELNDISPSKVNSFINQHSFSGGENKPALFNGIIDAIERDVKILEPAAIRAMIVIGDMGNLGGYQRVHGYKDKKGINIEKVANLLSENDFDFHALHTEGNNDNNWQIKSFKDDVEEIISQLEHGEKRTSYTSINNSNIEETINYIVNTLFENRFRMSIDATNVASGKQSLIGGTVSTSYLIEAMKRLDIDLDNWVNAKIKPFTSQSFVLPNDAYDKEISYFDEVILLTKKELQKLQVLLSDLTETIKLSNITKVWGKVLATHTGGGSANYEDESVNDASKRHNGLNFKSEILRTPLKELKGWSKKKITNAINQIKVKQILISAVLERKVIEVFPDPVTGEIHQNDITNPNKLPDYFFGSHDDRKVWLNVEKYIP